MQRSRLGHLARGLAAASAATFAALCSHVSMGGSVPGVLGVLVPWMLSVTVCTLVAGRRLSTARLVPAVVISQLLFHTLFVLGTQHIPIAASGHHHPSLPPTELATALGTDGPMWLGHAIAAALTIVIIRRSDAALGALRTLTVRIVAWVTRRWQPVLDAPISHRPRLVSDSTFTRRALRNPLLASLRRRGPPPLLAC